MRRAGFLAVLLLAGCPTKEEHARRKFEAIHAQFSELTDLMCACKDQTCADEVQAKTAVWTQERAKDNTNDEVKPTPEQTKKFVQLGEKYGLCMTKAMGVGREGPER